jgi:hypothetical protein
MNYIANASLLTSSPKATASDWGLNLSTECNKLKWAELFYFKNVKFFSSNNEGSDDAIATPYSQDSPKLRLLVDGSLTRKTPDAVRRALPGSGDYYVLDTDYDSYAIIYSCSNIASLLHAGMSFPFKQRLCYLIPSFQILSGYFQEQEIFPQAEGWISMIRWSEMGSTVICSPSQAKRIARSSSAEAVDSIDYTFKL